MSILRFLALIVFDVVPPDDVAPPDDGARIRLGLNDPTKDVEASEGSERARSQEATRWMKVGMVTSFAGLFGFFVYAVWLDHGFQDSPVIELVLTMAVLSGVGTMTSAAGRRIGSSAEERWTKGGMGLFFAGLFGLVIYADLLDHKSNERR